MKKLLISVQDEIKTLTVMPSYGALVTDDEGNECQQGRFWLPNCSVLIDIGANSTVIGVYSLPNGAVAERDDSDTSESKSTNVTATGVPDDLFLKTVALLTDKEKLDKMV